MSLSVTNHWIEGADRVPTIHTSGKIKPDGIVVHETTSRLAKGNVVQYLRKNDRKVSYHVVIERDGTIVQMAPLDARAHHAGRSEWRGRKFCNSFMVGVAIVGPGPLSGTKQRARSWWGGWFGEADDIVELASPYHGNKRLWLKMTPEQDKALVAVNQTIAEAYNIHPSDIVGHYQVSPGRKVDPPPFVRLQSLEPAEGHAINTPAVVQDNKPAHKELIRKSRKYRTSQAGKVVSGGAAIGATVTAAGDTLGKMFEIDKIKGVKAHIDTINGVIADYGVLVFLAGCIGSWLVYEYLQSKQREDYDEGRSEPSGDQMEGAS